MVASGNQGRVISGSTATAYQTDVDAFTAWCWGGVCRGKAANITTFGFNGISPIPFTMTDKNYVVRPWTEEEGADFERFCASIGEIPSDPGHARLMEDGAVDFFSLDEWWDLELPRA